MAQVKIRNLDDDVLAVLKHRASIENRSLEEELRRILTLAAQTERSDFIREARSFQESSTAFGSQIDSVTLLREDRDR